LTRIEGGGRARVGQGRAMEKKKGEGTLGGGGGAGGKRERGLKKIDEFQQEIKSRKFGGESSQKEEA